MRANAKPLIAAATVLVAVVLAGLVYFLINRAQTPDPAPVAATEPHECTFRSTSAAIRMGACNVESSSNRGSDKNDRARPPRS